MTTEAQYVALTAACDALLTARPMTPEKISVSWLHVRNAHPCYFAPYQTVFKPQRRLGRFRAALERAAGIARGLGRALARSPYDFTGGELPPRADVLVLSHLVNADSETDTSDFYFGNLQQDLWTGGKSSVLVLLDQTGLTDAKRWSRGGPTARVVLPRWFSLVEEVRMIGAVRRAAAELRSLARGAPLQLQRTVGFEAARHARAPLTLVHLRIYHAVERLCRRFRPKAIIVTWEGHAWERLAFRAARSTDAGIKCIGYQHTVLLPRTHALRRALGEGYDPDVILTVGEVTRDLLARDQWIDAVRVLSYGSYRHPARPEMRAADQATRCLVIPEGLESECLTLFEFARRAAERTPQIQFLLRMHPVLPFARLARRHGWLAAMPPNVVVSDEPAITADFARCACALYRGSSAAVYAVLAGVRPVYVEQPGELSIDPLFALDGWRKRVASVDALDDVLRAEGTQTADDRRAEWEPARALCSRYVVAPQPEVVLGLLQN